MTVAPQERTQHAVGHHEQGIKTVLVLVIVTFSDYFYAYHTQIIIGTASFLYLDPFIRH